MTVKRRVLAVPDGIPAGGQIQATYNVASAEFYVGVRPDQWAAWSSPLEEVSRNDDPTVPGSRVRGALGPDPVEVAVVAQALDGVYADMLGATPAVAAAAIPGIAAAAAIAALDRHRAAMATVPVDDGMVMVHVANEHPVSPDAEVSAEG